GSVLDPEANGIASCPVPSLRIVQSFPRSSSKKRCASYGDGKLPMRIGSVLRCCCSCTTTRTSRMLRHRSPSNSTPTPCAFGVNDGPGAILPLAMRPARADPRLFPPLHQALVKAVACEAIHETDLPLSRLSTSDLTQRVCASLGRSISPSTVWRILDADA